MSDWQRKVDFSATTEKWDNAEIGVQEFAKIVAETLRKLKKFGDPDIDYQLEYLIESFEDIAQEEEDDYLLKEEFNYNLNCLYDWGDTSLDGKFGGKKVCWVQMR